MRRLRKNKGNTELNIRFVIAPVGDMFMAVTILGGITVRAGRGDSEAEAVRQVLRLLAGPLNEDAAMALELALEGQTIEQVLNPGKELPSGS